MFSVAELRNNGGSVTSYTGSRPDQDGIRAIDVHQGSRACRDGRTRAAKRIHDVGMDTQGSK